MTTKAPRSHHVIDGCASRGIWKTSHSWWYQRFFFGFGAAPSAASFLFLFRAMIGNPTGRESSPASAWDEPRTGPVAAAGAPWQGAVGWRYGRTTTRPS